MMEVPLQYRVSGLLGPKAQVVLLGLLIRIISNLKLALKPAYA